MSNGANSVNAQAPFPEIEIEEPNDEEEIAYGESILVRGSSSVGAEDPPEEFHLIIINRYGSTTITRTHTSTIDESGEWEDEMAFTFYGPGTWSVEVYLDSDPLIRDFHSGEVAEEEE